MSAPILPTSNRIQALRVQEFLREGESEATAAPQQQSSSPVSQGFSSAPSVVEPQKGIPGAPGQDGLPGAPGADGLGVDDLLQGIGSGLALVVDRDGDPISLPPGVAMFAHRPAAVFLKMRNGDSIKRG